MQKLFTLLCMLLNIHFLQAASSTERKTPPFESSILTNPSQERSPGKTDQTFTKTFKETTEGRVYKLRLLYQQSSETPPTVTRCAHVTYLENAPKDKETYMSEEGKPCSTCIAFAAKKERPQKTKEVISMQWPDCIPTLFHRSSFQRTYGEEDFSQVEIHQDVNSYEIEKMIAGLELHDAQGNDHS